MVSETIQNFPVNFFIWKPQLKKKKSIRTSNTDPSIHFLLKDASFADMVMKYWNICLFLDCPLASPFFPIKHCNITTIFSPQILLPKLNFKITTK